MLLYVISALFLVFVKAQTNCSSSLQSATSPVATTGFAWDIIATNVSSARGIIFDSQGRLLVVKQGMGIVALTLSNDSCAVLTKTTTVLQNSSLNHGIEFSPDGTTLYASSSDSAWSWEYNVSDASVVNPRLLVGGMGDTTHSTRTLQISPLYPNLLMISRGSDGNIDTTAAYASSGHSQVKVFDLNHVPNGGYDYTQDGGILAYGVRNEVGITSDRSGNIWGVMNSADQMTRNGTDISKDNPSEELHYCTPTYSFRTKIKLDYQRIQKLYISDIRIVLEFGIHHHLLLLY
jgi:glucose/arabinose dehydrogenase